MHFMKQKLSQQKIEHAMTKNDPDIQAEKALIDLSEAKHQIYQSGKKLKDTDSGRGTTSNGIAPTQTSTGLSHQAPMFISHTGGMSGGLNSELNSLPLKQASSLNEYAGQT